MILHGKGKELRELFLAQLKDISKIDEFKKQYGSGLFDIMWDNFMYPLLECKDPQKQKEIVGKLDLFTASFLNPLP